MKHKHCDLIKAWADGAKIQYKENGEWIDVVKPNWHPDYTYRIKPVLKYRVALMKYYDAYSTLTSQGTEVLCLENSPNFIRWLTDWIEVDL